jgi:hypothetical protein
MMTAVLESEMYRYTVFRQNSQKSIKLSNGYIALFIGDNTPMWRLLLMALSLMDNEYRVLLVPSPISIESVLDFKHKLKFNSIVFYQDGLWKNDETKNILNTTDHNKDIYLCGTAPYLSLSNKHEWVYKDVDACMNVLLSQDR